MDKEEKHDKLKAEEIAEIIVASMIANMKNPNFLEEKERIYEKNDFKEKNNL